MPSFFEKLKKGMGVEEPVEKADEEELKEKIVKKPRVKKVAVKTPRKLEVKAALVEEEIGPEENPPAGGEEEQPEKKKIEIETEKESKEKWFEPEGQLAIDVFQTKNDLVIQSAIAGVKPDSLDISMEKDIIIIKGTREKPLEENGDYFAQECFWGPFSREVILPAEIDPNRAKAEMKEGILTIRMPKILREKKRRIIVTS